MHETPRHTTVAAAVAAVMADVQAVRKGERNNHANYNFRGIDSVMNAVGPALRRHGVVVVPQLDDVAYEQVQTSQGKPANACRVKVTYRFWYGDESLATSVAAEAWDHGDKATPKAMSVAFRTALLQSLTLPTDEPDPDEHTYERAESKPEPPQQGPSEKQIGMIRGLLKQVDDDRRRRTDEWLEGKGGIVGLTRQQASTLIHKLQEAIQEADGEAADAAEQGSMDVAGDSW